MKKIILILSIISLTGCDVRVDDGGVDAQGGKQNLKYSYSVNGCETGEKSFSSLTDLCYGLANDEMNNFCAGDLRCDRFKRDCQGLQLDVTCD